MGYSEFLRWLADGDLAGFAEGVRWRGWEYDIRTLDGDDGLFVAPPLWAEGPPVAERDRARVPMTELWTYAHVTMQQLEQVPPGSAVGISGLGLPTPDREDSGRSIAGGYRRIPQSDEEVERATMAAIRSIEEEPS
jgi:hypothetical protein